MGGAGGEGAHHGDAVGRDAGEVHALEGEESVFGAVRPGEAGDEGGPGDDLFERQIVEQVESGIGAVALRVEVEKGGGDEGVGEEAELEDVGVEGEAGAEETKEGEGFEDEGEGVVVGRERGESHLAEDEQRGGGAEGEERAHESVADERWRPAEVGEEEDGGAGGEKGERGGDERG